MTRAELIDLQRRIGTPADGFWGPKSIAACQRHLRRLMPSPHPFPRADQRSLTAFYGEAGNVRQMEIDLPWPMSNRSDAISPRSSGGWRH